MKPTPSIDRFMWGGEFFKQKKRRAKPVSLAEWAEADHPRADDGKFTDGADGGAKDSFWGRLKSRFKKEEQVPLPLSHPAVQRLRGLLPHAKDDHVMVEDHPTAIAAAEFTSKTLDALKRDGYTMPTAIVVERADVESMRGHTLAGIGQNGEVITRLKIQIPRTIPADADLDAVTRLAFSAKTPDGVDKFAVQSFGDLVVHEMGHVLHAISGRNVGYNFTGIEGRQLTAAEKKIAMTVSEYASTSDLEYVAEAFTRLRRGERLPDAAMVKVIMFGGPDPFLVLDILKRGRQ